MKKRALFQCRAAVWKCINPGAPNITQLQWSRNHVRTRCRCAASMPGQWCWTHWAKRATCLVMPSTDAPSPGFQPDELYKEPRTA